MLIVRPSQVAAGAAAGADVVDDWGVFAYTSADTGVDYDAAPSGTTDKEVAYLKAITDVVRQYHLGAIWCHTIGGRTTAWVPSRQK